MALFFIVPRCVLSKKAVGSLVSRFTACSTVEEGFAPRSARLLTSTYNIVARRTDGQRTQAGMGDTGSALHTRLSDRLAYFQQRSLGAVDTARRADVPGDAATQQRRGATANGPGRVQPEKMKPCPMPIGHIIQPCPPQMLRADGVEKRGHPILHNHLIIRMGSLG